MKATVNWIASANGGRANIPIGPTYSTVAKFSEDGVNWQHSAWSVVLTFLNPSQALTHFAEVRFLRADAPSHRLIRGRKFELFEGSKLVAHVELE